MSAGWTRADPSELESGVHAGPGLGDPFFFLLERP